MDLSLAPTPNVGDSVGEIFQSLGLRSVGTPGSVAGIIGVTTAEDIDVGELWFAAAPATLLDTIANAELEFAIGDGADIQANVLVAPITDGTIVFNLIWWPLADNGNLVAA